MTLARIRRACRYVGRWIATAPGTHIYLLALLVTTQTVRSVHPLLADELLRQVSTNLTQMGRSSVRVLMLSAFLVDGGSWIVQFVWFSAVYAPLERWVGSWRWLGVVAGGHVGATLVTTVGIWADVRSNRSAIGLGRSVDVGVSYGFYAAAAFVTLGFGRRWLRGTALTALMVVLFAQVVRNRTFTDVGHVAAATLGAAASFVIGPGVNPGSTPGSVALSWRLPPAAAWPPVDTPR